MAISIGGRLIGPRHPLFVIAEIGLNHGGSPDKALALVNAAAGAGASAVKVQTLKASHLVAAACPAPAHVRAASLREFFRAFELSADAHAAVARRVRQAGLALMSTPFHEDAVPMLESIGVDAYKIASGDITHDRLIRTVAATGKPMVISTGMSDLDDVAQAVQAARDGGAREIALLHCVSVYPVPDGAENLGAIAELARAFKLPVGLSDHTTDPQSVVIAVALGATLYEKHLVLDGDDTAIDGPVSATPAQLAALVRAGARTQMVVGRGHKCCLAAEAPNRLPSRRSLYATRTIRLGEVIDAGAITALRPGDGLDPRRWRELVGTVATRLILADEPFGDQDLAVRFDRGGIRDVA